MYSIIFAFLHIVNSIYIKIIYYMKNTIAVYSLIGKNKIFGIADMNTLAQNKCEYFCNMKGVYGKI